jgi:hypothetical protein
MAEDDEQLDLLDEAQELTINNDDVTFTRIAVTPAQIKQYRLPTAPPKPKDKRKGFTDNKTCQAEALPPDALTTILRTAITTRLKQSAYKRVLREEQQVRRAVLARLTSDDD